MLYEHNCRKFSPGRRQFAKLLPNDCLNCQEPINLLSHPFGDGSPHGDAPNNPANFLILCLRQIIASSPEHFTSNRSEFVQYSSSYQSTNPDSGR
jgi:hypothetical protein